MTKLFRLIAVLAIIIVGLGFYRGWFTVTGDREAVSNNIDVKLSVDTDKVRHDTEVVKESLKSKDSHDEQ